MTRNVLSHYLFNLVCCFNFLPSRPASNEPHARNSRRPFWTDLPTNGFASHLCLRDCISPWMKRELERISGHGSVDVDSPRAKRRKEHAQVAMPATTSRFNNFASNPGAIMFKQDVFSLVDRQGCDKRKVGFPRLSPFQLPSCPFRGCRGRLLSTEFIRVCRQSVTMRTLTSKSKIRSPRRNQVSDRNWEVHQPGRSQTGPRTLFQEREGVQCEG